MNSASITDSEAAAPAVAREAVELPEPWASEPIAVVVPTYNEARNVPPLAERVFALPGRSRVMRDEIGVRDGALVDRLGSPVRAEAVFRARVIDGGLRLASTRVALCVGRLRLPLPRGIAPVVVLTERREETHDAQHVSIVVAHPLLGRLYQYAGTFRYDIAPGE